MGVYWAFLYAYLLQKKYLRPDKKKSIAAGVISGIVAVACWKCMFALSARRPPTDEKRFYLHLVPAHIIFSLVTIAFLRRQETQGK
jgi:hypothetical protein